MLTGETTLRAPYVVVDHAGLVRGAYSLIPEEYVDSARDISAIANGVFGAWAWSTPAKDGTVPVALGMAVAAEPAWLSGQWLALVGSIAMLLFAIGSTPADVAGTLRELLP